MTFKGMVRNGVIVLEPGVGLPDGTEVTVVLPQFARVATNESLEAERDRRRKALSELLAMPDENPEEWK